MTGVEPPPDRPGLAVIKRVSAVEAEPGDTLTYAIVYRNMGNTPIRSVTIVDSLLPRLEYVKGTVGRPRGNRLHDGRQPRWCDRAALGAARHARAGRHRICLVPGDRSLIRPDTIASVTQFKHNGS